jgi:hypothetical protein
MRILSKQAADSPRIRRVNLIFHGLVAFFDAGPDHYNALIPETSCTHDARYGDPLDSKGPKLADDLRQFHHDPQFPAPSLYQIEGVLPANSTRICAPNPADAIVLTGLVADESKIRIKIRVPKPEIIRHYRGTETHGLDITGGDAATQGCLAQIPVVVHEVTVFSYFAFYEPSLVGPDDYFRIPKRSLSRGDFWNLCIYAQPLDTDNCSSDDSQALNQMFVIKSVGRNPSTDVSLDIGSDDGPPLRISDRVGLQCVELLALSELNAPNNDCDCTKSNEVGVEGPSRAVPGGCSGLFAGG